MMKEIAAAQKQEQQRQEKFARAQKKELFSAVQEMIGQEKIPQAERLIEQFASAYPGDYWVGVLQRQLDKKKKIIARREDVARQAAARSIVAVEKKEEEEPIVVASQPAPVIGKKTSEIVSPLVSVPVKVSRTADRPVTAHVPADRAQKKAIARALDNKIEELKDANIKKLDALVDNGKAEQAGKILMQLVESYPDDPKVKKAQRVLEEKIEHMQERQRRYAAWALQERIRTQYDQRIQKIKVLLSKKQKDEALSLLSALPEELRANDPRIKKIERQIQRLKEKARMASAPSVKPVKSVQKKRKITSVSTDASAISYGQFQEKQSYVEKLYAEGIRLYEQGLYDDAVRVFRIVVKMEKGITAAFTPAAKEYIKKAEDHKKDLASDR